MKLAKIEDGKVINIILSETLIEGYVECSDDVGKGFDYAGGIFIDPRPEPIPARKTIYSKFSFKKLFTPVEWKAIKDSEDPLIESFVEDFDIADYMNLDHEDVVAGLDYLESTLPEFESGRADEIRGL